MSSNTDDSADVAQSREISPFCDEVKHIRCPSCHHPTSFHGLNKEGGTQCDGCGRKIVLKIESYDKYPEWRNVPKGSGEMYR